MFATKIKVEIDTAPDAWDFGGWRVIEETKHRWCVMFRGDIAECEDFADDARQDLTLKKILST